MVRRDDARRLLDRLLLGALLLTLAPGVPRALRARSPPAPPVPPIAVDLARDPVWRLALLPGVGFASAVAIAEDRKKNGPLTRLADLDRVPGFGPGRAAALAAATEVRVVIDGKEVRAP